MRGPFNDKQIERILDVYFDKFSFSWVEQGVSTFTLKILVEDEIYFMSIPKTTETKLGARHEVMRLLLAKGVRVPEPVAFLDDVNEINGHSYLIMKEILGDSLLNMINNQKKIGDLSLILAEVGKTLALMHTEKDKSFGYVSLGETGNLVGESDSYFDHFTSGGGIPLIHDSLLTLLDYALCTKEESNLLEDYILNNISLFELNHGYLSHMDISFEHIFSFEGRFSGLIDWDGASFRSKYYDFVKFQTYHGDENLGYILDSYFMDIDRDEDFEERLRFERVMFCLLKTAKAYKKHGVNEGQYSMLAEKKIKEEINLLVR